LILGSLDAIVNKENAEEKKNQTRKNYSPAKERVGQKESAFSLFKHKKETPSRGNFQTASNRN
jgi:hypothetical protein